MSESRTGAPEHEPLESVMRSFVHELRQSLAVISVVAGTARRTEASSGEGRTELATIERQVKIAANLCNTLIERIDGTLEIRLDRVVGAVLNTARLSFGGRVHVDLEPASVWVHDTANELIWWFLIAGVVDRATSIAGADGAVFVEVSGADRPTIAVTTTGSADAFAETAESVFAPEFLERSAYRLGAHVSVHEDLTRGTTVTIETK